MSHRPHVAAALLAALACAAAAEETSESWAQWSRRRAEALAAAQQYEAAVEEWVVVAHLQPGAVAPYVRAGVLAVESVTTESGTVITGKPITQIAEQCVREGVKRGGRGDPGLAYIIGRLRLAEDKRGDAWKMLREAKESGFDPVLSRYWFYRATVNRAAWLIDDNRAPDAIAELEELRRAQPGHPDEPSLIVNLAAAHRAMQEPQPAARMLEELLAKSPGNASALFLAGRILMDEGRLEEALDRFRKAQINSSPSADDKTYTDSLLRICDALIKLGRLDEAEGAAMQELEIKRDDPSGLFALGRVNQERGDPASMDKALRLYRRVVRRMPDARDTLMALKQVLIQLGETAEAEEVQRRLDEIQRGDARQINGTPQLMGPGMGPGVSPDAAPAKTPGTAEPAPAK